MYVFEMFLQALQGMQLATDALTECANCLVLNVSSGEQEQCGISLPLKEQW